MILICKKNIEIKMCDNFFNRLIGLMLKKNINYGLCFKRCNSIHTFFMRENIDVILCDKNNTILYFYHDLDKNRVILPKKDVSKVFELPVGYFHFKVKDKDSLYTTIYNEIKELYNDYDINITLDIDISD